jgi:hypothetical protein
MNDKVMRRVLGLVIESRAFGESCRLTNRA